MMMRRPYHRLVHPDRPESSLWNISTTRAKRHCTPELKQTLWFSKTFMQKSHIKSSRDRDELDGKPRKLMGQENLQMHERASTFNRNLNRKIGKDLAIQVVSTAFLLDVCEVVLCKRKGKDIFLTNVCIGFLRGLTWVQTCHKRQ